MASTEQEVQPPVPLEVKPKKAPEDMSRADMLQELCGDATGVGSQFQQFSDTELRTRVKHLRFKGGATGQLHELLAMPYPVKLRNGKVVGIPHLNLGDFSKLEQMGIANRGSIRWQNFTDMFKLWGVLLQNVPEYADIEEAEIGKLVGPEHVTEMLYLIGIAWASIGINPLLGPQSEGNGVADAQAPQPEEVS